MSDRICDNCGIKIADRAGHYVRIFDCGGDRYCDNCYEKIKDVTETTEQIIEYMFMVYNNKVHEIFELEAK
jgi:hypothetical protein